ncbi:serine/threonine-protein phosphatase 6 regulatory ankyrin repeat subunit A [Patella vulgata]|uniref:serine/threonine-protein phosphatase 6 regulatory ankyrin repeat subunit A n=1 Tax=Patella vulgata TaxID=6465 RepID=UPI00218098DB|nr:serine/threonine-protein phosphatase 6 regulatory ankyrin repeat subunit A [Patella vulgata]XP_050409435.1 serine/threonine-protein phosphatase 6 regulatory ankyrin repeat subunit A [Patella vulgata]
MATGTGRKRKHSATETSSSAKLLKISRELMPLLDKAKICREYSFLVQQLNVKYLTDDLFSESIIDDDDMESVQIELTNNGTKAATRKLLDILCHRGEKAFTVFLDVLYQNGYKTVKERLELDPPDELTMSDIKSHEVCRTGTLSDVKKLIAKPEDVIQKDSSSRTPIFYCCISSVDSVNKLKYILDLGEELDETSIKDLVYACCKFGELETVNYLFKYLGERSTKCNYDDYERMLICCVLSEKQTTEKIQLIVGKSDVKKITKYVLHLACFFSTFEVVDTLTKLYPGINVNEQLDNGFVPLHYCYLSAIDSVKKIQLLEAKGAKIDIHDENDLFLKACEEATLETVELLVKENGAIVNCTDEIGTSPLLYCIASKKEPIRKINFLREKGAIFEDKLLEGRSEDEFMLCVSCEIGALETVKYFVTKGVNVNCRDSNDQTPAFYCCRSNEGPIEKLSSLKDSGAKFNVLDIEHRSLLYVACYEGGVETVKYLIKNQPNTFINLEDKKFNTPFTCCCRSKVDACEKLKHLRSLDDAVIKNKGNEDRLLHVASSEGDQSILNFLIDTENANRVNNFGETPLFMSCQSKRQPFTKTKLLLESKGGKLDIRYKDGDILLHVACRFGNLSTVKYLATKMDLKAENEFGETPLQHCKRSKIQRDKKVSFLEKEISKLESITQP